MYAATKGMARENKANVSLWGTMSDNRYSTNLNAYKLITKTTMAANNLGNEKAFHHVGLLSASGAADRDRVDAALPQLPQKSSSGWSFSPHFLQNIVTLPLPVYANYGEPNAVFLATSRGRPLNLLG